jgi:outer membrane cobalamin receptor
LSQTSSHHRVRRAVAAVAFGFAGAAYAQDTETDAATVDDIIVTAQKREQSLQDVPIVVTSLSASSSSKTPASRTSRTCRS